MALRSTARWVTDAAVQWGGVPRAAGCAKVVEQQAVVC